MKKTNTLFMMLSLAFAGLVSGYYFNNWMHEKKMADTEIKPTQNTAISSIRPLFKLKDLNGKVRDIKEWDGEVLMINFWATWCPPCRKEIPAFIKLKEKYAAKKFNIIGIALDEKQAVIHFTDPMDMNYPILLSELDGIPLTKAYGNRLGVLPYTVFVDRKGKIIHRTRKELSFEEAEALIKPLL